VIHQVITDTDVVRHDCLRTRHVILRLRWIVDVGIPACFTHRYAITAILDAYGKGFHDM